MTRVQYKDAEHLLIGRMQLMLERDKGCLLEQDSTSSPDDDSAYFDDAVVRVI